VTAPAKPVKTAAERYDAMVTQAVLQLAVKQKAAEKYAAITAKPLNLPAITSLGDFLAVPDDLATYRVDQLWPTGGNVLLAAQAKAGKSTAMLNLIKSLVDGRPFLGQYEARPAGRVVLLDNELDERNLRRWLREIGITNTDRVQVMSLRGKVSSFNVTDKAVRSEWAKILSGADVLILDCLRPVLDALGLDEHRDAGKFLEPFTELLGEAGIGESLIVHHMGHGGERSRGDSRLIDWPDAGWRLIREGEPPNTQTYFTAKGRDVEVYEKRLAYTHADRSLVIVGGSRKDVKLDGALDDVLGLLRKSGESMSGRAVIDALAGQVPRTSVTAALKRGRAEGSILSESGARGAELHYINPASAPVIRSAP
jgi:hypothetical protein